MCPRSSFSNCAKAQERKQKAHIVHPRSSFSSVAATSLPPLLLCCCCCAAASAVPRSAMHRGARSVMLSAMHTCNMQRVRRKVPLRCSIFFIWRSGLTRGAGTKTATRHSTSPPPLLLCCCCCAAAAVLLLLCCCCCAAEKLRTTSSSFPTCKISQGDA